MKNPYSFFEKVSYLRLFTGAMCFTLFSSCEKIVEVDSPRTQLVGAVVFEDDLTATAAIVGLYPTIGSGGVTSVNYLASLSADELKIEQGDAWVQFYQNELLSINPNIYTRWADFYQSIARANSIIEGLENSSKLTPSIKNQLLGEAKFFRAFNHFYLVNFFGDIPYITTTDYKVNGLVHRLPVAEVYEKMLDDILTAKGLLSNDYTFSNGERVRVCKPVASALLARIYLFKGNWALAEAQAGEIISHTSLFSLATDLGNTFLKNSSESIWQVIPGVTQKYTTEASIFIRTLYNPDFAVLSDKLYNSFEINDNRRLKWVGTGTSSTTTWYFPFKYKETFSNATGAEYYTVFRLAEQYLIRAEARARQNKLSGAISDINVIRNRAGLPNTTAITQGALLLAIEQERRVELFTEWGHRWFDLKRTNRATTVLAGIKPGWSVNDLLYPIPYSELQLNPNMKQNPGY